MLETFWNSPEDMKWASYALAGLMGLIALVSAFLSAWEKTLETRFRHWPVERYLGSDTWLWRIMRTHRRSLPYVSVLMAVGALLVLAFSIWGSELQSMVDQSRILHLEESNEELMLENRTVAARLDAVRADAEAAEAHAAMARAERDSAKQDAAAARLAATQAERERLRLEQMVQRSITSDQRKVFLKILGLMPGKIDAISTFNTPEATNYAAQIARLLVEADWHVPKGFKYRLINSGSTPAGVFVFVRNLETAPKHTWVLARALSAAKIAPHERIVVAAPNLREDAIELFISNKP